MWLVRNVFWLIVVVGLILGTFWLIGGMELVRMVVWFLGFSLSLPQTQIIFTVLFVIIVVGKWWQWRTQR